MQKKDMRKESRKMTSAIPQENRGQIITGSDVRLCKIHNAPPRLLLTPSPIFGFIFSFSYRPGQPLSSFAGLGSAGISKQSEAEKRDRVHRGLGAPHLHE